MKRFLLVCGLSLYFLTLGILFTQPLSKHFSQGLPYSHAPAESQELVSLREGDYLQLLYAIWLFKDAFLGHTPFLKDPYQLNVPFQDQNEFCLQEIPLSMLFAIFAIPFGDVMGYNLLVLLTFPLSGLGLYFLARLLTRSHWAGLIGGTIYCLYPYRMVHLLGGHPGGFVHFWIPWIVYLLVLGFQKRSWLLGFLSGLFFLGLGLNEMHQVYYLSLFLGAFLVLPLFRMSKAPSQKATILPFQKSLSDLRDPRLYGYFLMLAVLGLILGLFGAWWVIRRVEAFWVWGLVPLGIAFLFFFWVAYARGLSWLTGLPFSRTLREDAFTYLPLILLPLYGVQFETEVIGLGSRLLGLCGSAILLIKMYELFKFRQLISNRWGLSIRWVPGILKVLMAFVIGAGIFVSWIVYNKVGELGRSVISGGRPLVIVKGYSPRLEDIWRRFHEDGEKFIYLGIFALLLAVAGGLIYSVRLRKDSVLREKWTFGVLAVLFLTSYILSFGPNAALYNLFYEFVPFFDFIRVPTRVLYLSFFFLSLLASFGLKTLFQWMGRKSVWVALAFLLGICVDFLPARGAGISLTPRRHPVYEYVQGRVGDGRILEIPIWPGESAWSSVYQYYSTLYRTRMVNGYRAAIPQSYVDQVFKPLSPMNVGAVTKEIWQRLKEWNVRFVLVHEEVFPGKVGPFPPHFTTLRFRGSPFLKEVMNAHGVYLFEVVEDPIFPEKTSLKTSPVHVFMEAENLKKRLGERLISEDASGGKAVYVIPAFGDGYWVFGRARNYPGGLYRAHFRLKGAFDERVKQAVRLELWDVDRGILLASRSLKSEDFGQDVVFRDFALDFRVQDFSEVEVRVFYGGKGEVWFDHFSIGFSDSGEKTTFFEAEDFFHQGEILADPAASGGEAVRALRGSSQRDLIFGPYRPYRKGDYSLFVWMKVTDRPVTTRSADRVATLLATAGSGKRVLSSKVVQARQFKSLGGYQAFSLDFHLDQDEILEFVVRFEGVTDLWVDRLEVS